VTTPSTTVNKMIRARLALLVYVLSTLACSLQVDNTTPASSAPAKPGLTTPFTTPTTVLSADVTAQRSLNVRSGASKTFAAIGALYTGERVELTGKCTRGWAEITWEETTAWVYSGYLSDNSCIERKP
jgi:uncharacterized protein YgiM (DUF1202 family)